MTNHYDEEDEELRLRLILELRIKEEGDAEELLRDDQSFWLSLKPQGLRIEDHGLRIN